MKTLVFTVMDMTDKALDDGWNQSRMMKQNTDNELKEIRLDYIVMKKVRIVKENHKCVAVMI